MSTRVLPIFACVVAVVACGPVAPQGASDASGFVLDASTAPPDAPLGDAGVVLDAAAPRDSGTTVDDAGAAPDGGAPPDAAGGLDSGVWPDAATPDSGVDLVAEDRWLDATLGGIRSAAGLPALGAVVVRRDGRRALAATGLRSVGGGASVRTGDRWQMGSITKTLTAQLIDRLAQGGLLTWDTRLGDLYPALPMSAGMPDVTLRELAEHRSGLIRDPSSSWVPPEAGLTLAERRQALLREALLTELGDKRYSYSNLGYHLLGAVAETVTGQPWEDALRARVGDLVSMPSMVYGEPLAWAVDEPSPHVYAGGAYVAVAPRSGDVVYDTLAPAGHVSTDLEDFGRYLSASLAGAAGAGGPFRPEAFAGATKAVTWFITPSPGGLGSRLEHNGSNGRNYAVAELLPAADLAYVVVTNCAGGPNLQDALRRVRNAILTRYAAAPAPMAAAGRLEGEALVVDTWSADLRVQRLGGLSGGAQLWWLNAAAGEQIVLRGSVPPGRYALRGRLCFAADYGDVELRVGGQVRTISFTNGTLEWRDTDLGVVDLTSGTLSLEVTALDDAGQGGVLCHLGLDALELTPAP